MAIEDIFPEENEARSAGQSALHSELGRSLYGGDKSEDRFSPDAMRSRIIKSRYANTGAGDLIAENIDDSRVQKALEREEKLESSGWVGDLVTRFGMTRSDSTFEALLNGSIDVDKEKTMKLLDIKKAINAIHQEGLKDDTSGFGGDLASVGGYMEKWFESMAVGGAVGAGYGAATGVGALATAGVGATTGGIAFSAAQGRGMIFAELIERGIDYETAQKVSIVGGAAYGAIEQLTGLFPAKVSQPLMNIMFRQATRGIRGAALKTAGVAIANAGKKGALKMAAAPLARAGGVTLLKAGGEVLEEGLQKGTEDLSYIFASELQNGLAADGSPLEKMTASQVFQNMYKEAEAAIGTSLVLAGVGGGISQGAKNVRQTKQIQAKEASVGIEETEAAKLFDQSVEESKTAKDEKGKPLGPNGAGDIYIGKLDAIQNEKDAKIRLQEEQEADALEKERIAADAAKGEQEIEYLRSPEGLQKLFFDNDKDTEKMASDRLGEDGIDALRESYVSGVASDLIQQTQSALKSKNLSIGTIKEMRKTAQSIMKDDGYSSGFITEVLDKAFPLSTTKPKENFLLNRLDELSKERAEKLTAMNNAREQIEAQRTQTQLLLAKREDIFRTGDKAGLKELLKDNSEEDVKIWKDKWIEDVKQAAFDKLDRVTAESGLWQELDKDKQKVAAKLILEENGIAKSEIASILNDMFPKEITKPSAYDYVNSIASEEQSKIKANLDEFTKKQRDADASVRFGSQYDSIKTDIVSDYGDVRPVNVAAVKEAMLQFNQELGDETQGWNPNSVKDRSEFTDLVWGRPIEEKPKTIKEQRSELLEIAKTQLEGQNYRAMSLKELRDALGIDAKEPTKYAAEDVTKGQPIDTPTIDTETTPVIDKQRVPEAKQEVPSAVAEDVETDLRTKITGVLERGEAKTPYRVGQQLKSEGAREADVIKVMKKMRDEGLILGNYGGSDWRLANSDKETQKSDRKLISESKGNLAGNAEALQNRQQINKKGEIRILGKRTDGKYYDEGQYYVVGDPIEKTNAKGQKEYFFNVDVYDTKTETKKVNSRNSIRNINTKVSELRGDKAISQGELQRLTLGVLTRNKRIQTIKAVAGRTREGEVQFNEDTAKSTENAVIPDAPTVRPKAKVISTNAKGSPLFTQLLTDYGKKGIGLDEVSDKVKGIFTTKVLVDLGMTEEQAKEIDSLKGTKKTKALISDLQTVDQKKLKKIVDVAMGIDAEANLEAKIKADEESSRFQESNSQPEIKRKRVPGEAQLVSLKFPNETIHIHKLSTSYGKAWFRTDEKGHSELNPDGTLRKGAYPVTPLMGTTEAEAIQELIQLRNGDSRFQQPTISNDAPATYSDTQKHLVDLGKKTGGVVTLDRTSSKTVGHVKLAGGTSLYVIHAEPSRDAAGELRQTVNDKSAYVMFISPKNGRMTTFEHELGHMTRDILFKPEMNAIFAATGFDLANTDEKISRDADEAFARKMETPEGRREIANGLKKLSPSKQGVFIRAINKIVKFINTVFGTDIKRLGDAKEFDKLAESLTDFAILGQGRSAIGAETAASREMDTAKPILKLKPIESTSLKSVDGVDRMPITGEPLKHDRDSAQRLAKDNSIRVFDMFDDINLYDEKGKGADVHPALRKGTLNSVIKDKDGKVVAALWSKYFGNFSVDVVVDKDNRRLGHAKKLIQDAIWQYYSVVKKANPDAEFIIQVADTSMASMKPMLKEMQFKHVGRFPDQAPSGQDQLFALTTKNSRFQEAAPKSETKQKFTDPAKAQDFLKTIYGSGKVRSQWVKEGHPEGGMRPWSLKRANELSSTSKAKAPDAEVTIKIMQSQKKNAQIEKDESGSDVRRKSGVRRFVSGAMTELNRLHVIARRLNIEDEVAEVSLKGTDLSGDTSHAYKEFLNDEDMKESYAQIETMEPVSLNVKVGGELKSEGTTPKTLKLKGGNAMHYYMLRKRYEMETNEEQKKNLKQATAQLVIETSSNGNKDSVYHVSDAEADRFMRQMEKNLDVVKTSRALEKLNNEIYKRVNEAYKTVNGGKDLGRDDFYFHMVRDPAFIKKLHPGDVNLQNTFNLMEKKKGLVGIDPESLSQLKRVNWSTTPLIIRDVFGETSAHVNASRKYLESTLVKDFIERNITNDAMSTELSKTEEGRETLAYFEKFAEHVGGTIVEGDGMDKLVGNYLKSATPVRLNNPAVWLKQPASMFAAIASFGGNLKYIKNMVGKRDNAFIDKVVDASGTIKGRYDTKTYSPFLEDFRGEGMQSEITGIYKNRRSKYRDKSTKFGQKMMHTFDRVAINGIIMGARQYVLDQDSSLTGNALVKATAKAAARAVKETQVATYGVDRTLLEQTINNPFKKLQVYMWGARGAQLNVLTGAMRDIFIEGNYQKGMNILIAGGLMQTAAVSAVDALRDSISKEETDDDDEEKVNQANRMGVAILENLVGIVPMVNEFSPAIFSQLYSAVGDKERASSRTWRVGKSGTWSSPVVNTMTLLSLYGRYGKLEIAEKKAKTNKARKAVAERKQQLFNSTKRATLSLFSESTGIPLNQVDKELSRAMTVYKKVSK